MISRNKSEPTFTQWSKGIGKAVIYNALHKGDVNYRLTEVKHITVSLVAFSRFTCVHSCKEISLLRISRFVLLKKANGETL